MHYLNGLDPFQAVGLSTRHIPAPTRILMTRRKRICRPSLVCVDCGTKIKHAIFEWRQRYPFCRKCWKKYLKDWRDANAGKKPVTQHTDRKPNRDWEPDPAA